MNGDKTDDMCKTTILTISFEVNDRNNNKTITYQMTKQASRVKKKRIKKPNTKETYWQLSNTPQIF